MEVLRLCRSSNPLDVDFNLWMILMFICFIFSDVLLMLWAQVAGLMKILFCLFILIRASDEIKQTPWSTVTLQPFLYNPNGFWLKEKHLWANMQHFKVIQSFGVLKCCLSAQRCFSLLQNSSALWKVWLESNGNSKIVNIEVKAPVLKG